MATRRPTHTWRERPPLAKQALDLLRKVYGRREKSRGIHRDASGDKYMATWELRAQTTPDELDGGWVAEMVDFPGCMAQGETEEEALTNLMDAFSGVMEARMQRYLRDERPADEPSSAVGHRIAIPVS